MGSRKLQTNEFCFLHPFDCDRLNAYCSTRLRLCTTALLVLLLHTVEGTECFYFNIACPFPVKKPTFPAGMELSELPKASFFLKKTKLASVFTPHLKRRFIQLGERGKSGGPVRPQNSSGPTPCAAPGVHEHIFLKQSFINLVEPNFTVSSSLAFI